MNDTSTYWQKQGSEPLFPDLLWSRPENRMHAGKLLIIGGNLHGFAAPASAYTETLAAGAGSTRVLLPDALHKTVGKMLDHGEFAPSTPSGSFGKRALAEWHEHGAWSDAVLLAGDLGRNSETAVTIEEFTKRYKQPLTITKDAIDYFYTSPKDLLTRPETTLVLSLSQLQKIARQAKWPIALTFDMGIAQIVEWLHDFTTEYSANIITYHNEVIFVAVGSKVSSTKVGELEGWRLKTASHAVVWLMQNSAKPFEALTLAVFESITK